MNKIDESTYSDQASNFKSLYSLNKATMNSSAKNFSNSLEIKDTLLVTGIDKSKYNTNFLTTIQEFANLDRSTNKLARAKSSSVLLRKKPDDLYYQSLQNKEAQIPDPKLFAFCDKSTTFVAPSKSSEE